MKYIFVIIIIVLNTSHIFSQDIVESENTISGRFIPPADYARRTYPETSYQFFLRNIPLKNFGSPVLLYNGAVKINKVHISVLNVPILKTDLIQCADAVIKLRAEYLFHNKRYDEIKFKITNGMTVPFSRFALGCRVSVKGNKTSWEKGNYRTGNTRAVLNEYLRFIYMYSGTLSLSGEMKPADINMIEIGDVFIQGGSPGHAVIVIDLAENKKKSCSWHRAICHRRRSISLKAFQESRPGTMLKIKIYLHLNGISKKIVLRDFSSSRNVRKILIFSS